MFAWSESEIIKTFLGKSCQGSKGSLLIPQSLKPFAICLRYLAFILKSHSTSAICNIEVIEAGMNT